MSPCYNLPFYAAVILTQQLPVNCRSIVTVWHISRYIHAWTTWLITIFVFSTYVSLTHYGHFMALKKYLQLTNFSLLLIVTSITDQRTGNHRQITVTVQHSTVQYSTVQSSLGTCLELGGRGWGWLEPPAGLSLSCCEAAGRRGHTRHSWWHTPPPPPLLERWDKDS